MGGIVSPHILPALQPPPRDPSSQDCASVLFRFPVDESASTAGNTCDPLPQPAIILPLPVCLPGGRRGGLRGLPPLMVGLTSAWLGSMDDTIPLTTPSTTNTSGSSSSSCRVPEYEVSVRVARPGSEEAEELAAWVAMGEMMGHGCLLLPVWRAGQ